MVEATSKPTMRPHDPVLGTFDEFDRAGQGSTPSWLQALRKGGIAHFAELGFPTTQHEEWRFTNVSPIAKTAWKLADGSGKATEKDVLTNLFPDVPGTIFARIVVEGSWGRRASGE